MEAKKKKKNPSPTVARHPPKSFRRAKTRLLYVVVKTLKNTNPNGAAVHQSRAVNKKEGPLGK